ncbi:hypothetical protein D3C81_1164840 [compost metagenome]
MEQETNDQQPDQDQDKAARALRINLVVDFLELGCSNQRIGEQEPAESESDHAPQEWNVRFRDDEHDEAGSHPQRRNDDLLHGDRPTARFQTDKQNCDGHGHRTESKKDLHIRGIHQLHRGSLSVGNCALYPTIMATR